MTVRLTCPSCGAAFGVTPPGSGGGMALCPSCGEPVAAKRLSGRLAVAGLLGGCLLISVLSAVWIIWAGEPVRRKPPPPSSVHAPPAHHSAPR
jgi:hypothetical protein